MIYIFDIDGTICSLVENAEYEKAKPLKSRIKKVNKLYSEGHEINLFTARGSSTGIDWTDITKEQLEKWGVKYNDLIMNCKPHGDIFVDDKAINADDFFK
tara:strand:- start:146 stop:445 length:300 start_codon:yes stop_codon:yes gene_type:complete